MIRDQLIRIGILKEATDIKKDAFRMFFIDEIKDVDTILNTEDLGDRDSVEILLTTDKNYRAGEPSDGTWYKIATEKLIKYISKTVDKFESGDFVDFMGSYKLEDLITTYMESELKMKGFKTWTEFVGAMEGDGKVQTVSEA